MVYIPKQIVVDYEYDDYQKKSKRAIKDLPKSSRQYIISLFPIITWIHRYNFTWFIRDLIAGVTVGIVVVPQSMGYAKIAQLSPQYGLYTAFVGLAVYCLFATSKDVSIGPTAVMSLLLGQSITHIQSTYTDISENDIAVTFSLICGVVAMFIGLIRLGILVDFIPGPAITGFMTASAITICISQWPKLFGIKSINTQDPPYLVLGNFFKNLPETKLDVAFGLTGLLWLYGVRFLCDHLSNKYPNYRSHFFYFSITRNAIVVIAGTLIAYLISIGKTTSPIYVLGQVPSGFQAMGVPRIDAEIITAISPNLPSAILILILEHVAIAKSFGRVNDYSINPNQEIIAIGFTNIWASFFGAYPSTGSFSRTAIKARSGVRTPIAGVFSSIVVILALYALTPAFYYLPDSILGAVVVHAVSDLVASPSYIKQLYKISIWELLVFVVSVTVTFFTAIEYGIYASIGVSILLLLFKISRPRFYNIDVIGDDNIDSTEKDQMQYLYIPDTDAALGHLVQPLPDGILMVRMDESWIYPNCAFLADTLIVHCKNYTRRAQAVISRGGRAWNDDADPIKDAARAQLPLLHALIIDFTRVNQLDSSGLQSILDVQSALNRYSGHHVEVHFVNIADPIIRQTLIIGGFGNIPGQGTNDIEYLYSSRSQHSSYHNDQITLGYSSHRFSQKSNISTVAIPMPKDLYPLFHFTADDAVRAAVSSLGAREQAYIYYPSV
ncbi:sulfate transporter family-domain-containing protein [Cunninghamella echinulata]|nr:sulfate transporter family-domain-containing protein [Cunninghamella echinulata]